MGLTSPIRAPDHRSAPGPSAPTTGYALLLPRYALQTVRARKAGFLGALAFLALLRAAALISACGTLLDTGLRGLRGLRGRIGTGRRYAATPGRGLRRPVRPPDHRLVVRLTTLRIEPACRFHHGSLRRAHP